VRKILSLLCTAAAVFLSTPAIAQQQARPPRVIADDVMIGCRTFPQFAEVRFCGFFYQAYSNRMVQFSYSRREGEHRESVRSIINCPSRTILETARGQGPFDDTSPRTLTGAEVFTPIEPASMEYTIAVEACRQYHRIRFDEPGPS
jgi:hypothetical protein